TAPNPMVGEVIVKDGRIIGEGYHEKCGGLHAERNALKSCVESPRGADMYVTLEPCCHTGRTPPCTEAIIENKIKRVFYGSGDPNPLVSGKSRRILEDAGIEVIPGIMKEECDKINPVFFHYIRTGTPYVVMKYAMTADGKICTVSGNSKWITGEKSRGNVHMTRRNLSAIMVGIGTVLHDDPILNCRCDDPIDPIRIICDSRLRIPEECNIVKTAGDIETYVAACEENRDKIKFLENKGIKVIITGQDNGRVDLKELMNILGKAGIDSILLEGGGELNFSALDAGIVSKVQAYIAPKIFGGSAKSPVGGRGADKISDAFMLDNAGVHIFGEDIMIEWEAVKCLRD
ncbi:MAG: bifunctional diaminohydroxyphosphoribosylaminopyrimidine deaminase/5-amino-6-(5-phosphoribosylamino)uracil reductase RibD, partial [Oscillospiraceae bacterium]|nr:bifunctional diaminohydroxyphosphoribosylaminopyrimidine deaminase/5-amino-6-(5-phosphoribosylamino)uracil reductase RibD [Oscillospiraceae bacterium]